MMQLERPHVSALWRQYESCADIMLSAMLPIQKVQTQRKLLKSHNIFKALRGL